MKGVGKSLDILNLYGYMKHVRVRSYLETNLNNNRLTLKGSICLQKNLAFLRF